MPVPDKRLKENISSIVASSLCTGCGTCASVCQVRAIEISLDESSGTRIPSVHNQRCVECGMCLQVCPGGAVNLDRLNVARFGASPVNSDMGFVKGVFFGNSSDMTQRLSSSSGGLVTSLLVHALDSRIIDGALVTRMSKDSPFEPQPFIARTSEEIITASKSKYCPVPVNTALREILNTPGRYAVVGLPCHIHGICKAMEVIPVLRERIVLLFGLACNHTPTYYATEYLLRRNRIPMNQIVQISYRGEGWPGVLLLMMRDGTRRTIPFDSASYWGLAFQKFFFPLRCSVCIDKTCELADVTFMDAWLPELSDDSSGTSLIIVRTDSAMSLIRDASKSETIQIRPACDDDVRRSQSLGAVMSSRAAMTRLLVNSGSRVPDFGRPLPVTTVCDRAKAMMFNLRIRISEKKRLWMIIMLYERLWQLGREVKLRVKGSVALQRR